MSDPDLTIDDIDQQITEMKNRIRKIKERDRLQKEIDRLTLKPLKSKEHLAQAVNTIFTIVRDHYKLTTSLLFSKRGAESVSLPRQIILCLSRRLTGGALESIGKLMNRDHTTVTNACTAVQNRIDTSPEFAAEYATLEAKCHQAVQALGHYCKPDPES